MRLRPQRPTHVDPTIFIMCNWLLSSSQHGISVVECKLCHIWQCNLMKYMFLGTRSGAIQSTKIEGCSHKYRFRFCTEYWFRTFYDWFISHSLDTYHSHSSTIFINLCFSMHSEHCFDRITRKHTSICLVSCFKWKRWRRSNRQPPPPRSPITNWCIVLWNTAGHILYLWNIHFM